MSKNDAMMVHSISANTLNNAKAFSCNSVQGHHHSLLGVERYSDVKTLRWSMTVGCLLDPDSPAARYAQGNVVKTPVLGLGVILSERGNTLIISDMHLPYHHQDAFDFLYALKKRLKPVQILNVGDVIDHHRGSFHDSEPDAMDAETEYEEAKYYAQQLQKLFPTMTITEGNHDKIPKRKLKVIGLPESMMSDYNKLYDLKPTWKWTNKHMFDSLGGFPVTVPMVLNKRGRWDGSLI